MWPSKQPRHHLMCSTYIVVLPSVESGPQLRCASKYIDHGYFGPQTCIDDVRSSNANLSRLSPVVDFDMASFDDSDVDDEYVDYEGLPPQTSRRPIEYWDIGDSMCTYEFCNALFWFDERILSTSTKKVPKFSLCCSQGKGVLSFMKESPTLLTGLIEGSDERSRHFLENIRSYNIMFSFTSMGGRVEENVNRGRSPPIFKLHGQNYHLIGSLSHPPGAEPKYEQLYIYDIKNEVQNRFSSVRYPTMASASVNKMNPSLGVKATEGIGNLPKVVLTSSQGSEAELYLFGACVTSWKVGGKDLLFVRPDAVFNGQKPISGGMPHCFPQFGPGPIQQHGFARNMNWSFVKSENVVENPVITLELKDGPYSRSMWDYSFQALYKVTLHEKMLSTELRVTNTDQKPFSFTTALHTYFHGSIDSVSVRGLKGCKTLNKHPDPRNPVEGEEERDAVTFPGFVDCIYLDAPNELQLDNGLGDTITIKNTNWSDTVLWNPHLTMESCYKDFVCVENAKIGEVELKPNQSWTAVQHLSVS